LINNNFNLTSLACKVEINCPRTNILSGFKNFV
ncbi:MAG: hypothetical protein ACI88L_000149, partial [Candidatus Paceibacteria bacterium]